MMNPVAEEILMCFGMGHDEEFVEDYLAHIGMPRRSGRYPWGSGDNPYQRSSDFLSRVESYKKAGKTEKEIAEILGLTTKQYRQEISICKDQRRMLNVETAKRYRDKEGLNTSEIGRKMGVNESTVREWFKEDVETRMNATKETVDFLREQVKQKGMIDVGTGVDKELSTYHNLNVSKERLDTALYYLEKYEGYPVYTGGVPQPTNPGQQTTQRVLCVPGTKHKEIYEYDRVKTIEDYVYDSDRNTYTKFQYPSSMNSKRLMVRYDEEGGSMKDGIIELRRGVKDLSLGDARYSQVRILVDDKKYLKGMAVYGDDKDFPPGVDVIFNTNKSKAKAPGLDALKDISSDPDNPFGSLIKEKGGQSYYDDPKGKYTDPITGKKQSLSLINKRADEGDWTDWQDALPSQFLGKQSKAMAKKQLDLAKADKLAEFDEICSYNNPTVKKHLLDKFADECDSAAVHLKAAALPGQKYHVIIPINSLKENEVYAPQYKEGTKLALIRYPHGGTFEIPILTVNNKNVNAKKIIGTESIDAIGITKKNADRLSGADFDGDTVMCIPTHDSKGRVRITSTKELEDLKGFDPKLEYPTRPGMKYMKDPVTGTDNTQREMGVISNLITDMTLGGATEKELARAVKHSMVVIDAGKHKLDYKKSEVDNNIAELKQKYQRRVEPDGTVRYGGAGTLLSRSKGEETVDKRQGTPKVNLKGTKDYDPTRPEGALLYKTTDDLYYPIRKYDKKTGIVSIKTTDGKTVEYDVKDEKASKRYSPVKRVDETTGEVSFTDSTGKIKYKMDRKTQASTRMAETDDAMTLVSDYRHPMEIIYADYANSMKALANRARKTSATTGKIEYDKNAKETYRKEVDSLMNKLNTAQLNTVREREAQRRANVEVAAKKAADPSLSKKDIKKLNQQAMTKYRTEVSAVARRERNIPITDREWEAIQAGAISETKLKNILNNTDIDLIRERVMPRTTTTLSSAKVSKMKAMKASNYSLEQIAASLGVSPSTVSKYLKGVN